MTNPNSDQPKILVSKSEAKASPKAETKAVPKPGSTADAKDDLKSLPLAEVVDLPRFRGEVRAWD